MKAKQLVVLVLVVLMQVLTAQSQNPEYCCDIRNHSYVSSQTYEFDIYLTRSGITPFELANYQAAVKINPLLVSGGTITPALLPGSSQLVDAQKPMNISYDAATQTVMIAPLAPPRTLYPGTQTSSTSGTLIPDGEGLRVCRVQLTSNQPLGLAPLNPVWNFTVDPYHTIVSAFTGIETAKVNTIITNSDNHSRSFQLTALLEGPFNGSTMETTLNTDDLIPLAQPYNILPWNYVGTESIGDLPADVVDWVLIELRDATDPSLADPLTSRLTRALFITGDGRMVSLDGQSIPEINFVPDNNLYAVVRHRNHIDILSNGALIPSGNTFSYNFTTSLTQAYGAGNGYKEIGVNVFGLVSGDIDADGKVFASDFVGWATESGTLDVYSASDVDFDGQIFASDFVQWAGNSGVNNPVEGYPGGIPVYTTQVPGEK